MISSSVTGLPSPVKRSAGMVASRSTVAVDVAEALLGHEQFADAR